MERNWCTLDAIGEISKKIGKGFAQISLDWLLCQPGATASTLGARRLDQVADNLGAAGWELSQNQVSRPSQVSALPYIVPYSLIREFQRV